MEPNLSPGDIIPIYQHWQYEFGKLGKAKLLEFKREGLYYILDELTEDGLEVPEAEQTVYSYNRWLVEIVELNSKGQSKYKVGQKILYNVPYVKYVGIMTSRDPNAKLSTYRGQTDRFIEIDGKEVF